MTFSMGTKMTFGLAALLLSLALPFGGLESSSARWWELLDTYVRKPTPPLREASICQRPAYHAHVYSSSPLVVYLENFVSTSEAQQIIDANHLTSQAIAYKSHRGGSVNKTIRDAAMGFPSLSKETTLRCVRDRAMDLQGWRSDERYETTTFQQYTIGGHYTYHYDAYADAEAAAVGGNRASTFLVYLDANCTGGGTNFPRLPKPSDDKWCEFFDCEDQSAPGVTFKPIPGNAVFWLNIDDDNKLDRLTIHSGSEVTDGVKTILNIWTWRFFS